MKTTFFKTIHVIMLAILITSCEPNDDGIVNTSTSESISFDSKSKKSNNVEAKNSNNVYLWVIGIDGPYDVVNGVKIPKIGSYVDIKATNYKGNYFIGNWNSVQGGYEVVSSTSRGIRLKRINKEGSIIFFHYTEYIGSVIDNGIATFGLSAIPNPPPPYPCPTETHTKMSEGFSQFINALNYKEHHTYHWKVVNNGSTYYGSGRNVKLNGFGTFMVTLSVSRPGCITETRTQSFTKGNGSD